MLATVAPLAVFIDDPWSAAVGLSIQLPGGAVVRVGERALEQALEGQEDEASPAGMLVPAVIDTVDFPPAPILIPLYDLEHSFNVIERKPERTPASCQHGEIDLSCRACYARWWKQRAREEGLIDGS